MDRLGRGVKPASVTEKERMSQKQVGGSQKYVWNIPIGMYRELKYIQEKTGLPLPQVLIKMCRRGIIEWRKERGEDERGD